MADHKKEEQDYLNYRKQVGPSPGFIDLNTGELREVTPAAAAQMGVPIGPPRSYDVSPHAPAGGVEMPGNEPPPYYNTEAGRLTQSLRDMVSKMWT